MENTNVVVVEKKEKSEVLNTAVKASIGVAIGLCVIGAGVMCYKNVMKAATGAGDSTNA